MNKDYDVVIIGAGIIGACIAHSMAKQGRRTLNVDKLPAAGYGSTGNSCAIIRTHYSTLDGAALAYESYFDWNDWPGYVGIEDERGLAEFVRVGCLYTRTEANAYGKPLERISDELGVPWESWTAEQLEQKVSIISADSFFPARGGDDPAFGAATGRMPGVLYFPLAGYISDPQLATHNVQRAAEAAGGAFRFNAEVVEILRAGRAVAGVALGSGEVIDAPVVINAAGPHSAKVNDMAGVTESMNIKTRALRVEVAHVPSPAGFNFERNGIIGSDRDIGGYYRPEVGNHILIGSEEPECDTLDWVDPDDFDRNISEQARLQVLRAAQRFPELGIPDNLKGIVDLYDASDDWLPIYDKSALDGFYLAIGTSGNQFKNGPVVGRMMTALVSYCENGSDHDRKPMQFELERLKREVDVGFYSRLREINEDSSFCVVG